MIDCEARELDSSPLIKDVHLYQSMVGALQYTAQMVRPDIAAAVRSAAQRLAGPTENDLLAVKWIFRYLVGTIDFGLCYRPDASTIKIAYNPAHHARTKHFDVVHHFVRERVTLGDIQLVYCPTNSMTADVLTKELRPIKFAAHRKAMGMVQLSKL